MNNDRLETLFGIFLLIDLMLIPFAFITLVVTFIVTF